MNMERYHWRHYFGGVAFVLLTAQFFTGLFLTLFYQPHLQEAYASVQYLYNHFPTGALIRDCHRWIATFLLTVTVIHSVRSMMRKDFLNPDGTVLWLTGSLLILPLLGFLATGFILPWEWRAYWFMEMIPNYLGYLPLIGSSLQAFFIDVFTMNRAFVAHVVVLPLLTIVLVDYHILSKTRKKTGGVLRYLARHSLIAIPIFMAIVYLSIDLPMPTQDPEIIPMPLDGTYVPTAEWFLLIFWVPFMHFEGMLAAVFGFFLPVCVFIVLLGLPFYVRKKKSAEKPGSSLGKITTFASVLLVVLTLFGLMYSANYSSPTMGCNSCHNVSMGIRMGIPPKAFKDRNIVPLLADDVWMVKHWFIPQQMW